jgi:hypothetical protein
MQLLQCQRSFLANSAAVSILSKVTITSPVLFHGLHCRYHLPRSYWKLLQSPVAESFIFNQRAALVQYWQQHQQRLAPLGGSLELLRYALCLTASRTFNYNDTHFSLVPLVSSWWWLSGLSGL